MLRYDSMIALLDLRVNWCKVGEKSSSSLAACMACPIEGAPPIATDPCEFPDFRICSFFQKKIFENLRWDLGSGRAMQNGCGLQMDGFSAHFDSSGFIAVDFYDFCDFAIVSTGLMLFPEGPRTL